MNQNYDQVADLIAQGKFNWERDAVVAFLCSGTSLDVTDKTVADLGGQRRAVGPVTGRWLSDGLAMGLPVAFQHVSQGMDFQVILAQDLGNNDPVLLAFIDTNADNSPITLQRTGTLIIRPVLPTIEVPPERPPTIGVWMQLPA